MKVPGILAGFCIEPLVDSDHFLCLTDSYFRFHDEQEAARNFEVIFFKGAGPGTYWHTQDARFLGFLVSPGIQNLNNILTHIVAYSHPSPFLSMTASYAIAHAYASNGPGGFATLARPGYIYEIDSTVVSGAFQLIDPAAKILNQNNPLGTVPRLPTQHDGNQDLMLGLISPKTHGSVLRTPPLRKGYPLEEPPPAGAPAPVVDRELQAVAYALRDAEVLAGSNIPPACVINRHNVH